jgi:Rieske Fe-S protein
MNPIDTQHSRRAILGVGGAGMLGAGLMVLTGCSSSSKSTDTPAAASTTTVIPTSSEPTTSAPAATTAETSSAETSSAETSSAATTGAIAKLSDVPVGSAIAVTIGGVAALLSQPTAGTVKAFNSRCTHMGCKVNPGPTLDCPCHQSKYNSTTGAVISGPAPAPLAPIAVKISGTSVVAG